METVRHAVSLGQVSNYHKPTPVEQSIDDNQFLDAPRCGLQYSIRMSLSFENSYVQLQSYITKCHFGVKLVAEIYSLKESTLKSFGSKLRDL